MKKFLRWTLVSIITGLTVGGFSTLFAFMMNVVTDFRSNNDYIIYFLPFAGLITVFLYNAFKFKDDKGTNLVLSTIHAQSEIPFKMAPLIFITTILTHLLEARQVVRVPPYSLVEVSEINLDAGSNSMMQIKELLFFAV